MASGLNKSSVSFLLSKNDKETLDTATTTTAVDKHAHTLPIEKLQRGQYQPRQQFGSEQLAELAESIKAQGIIQPIVVRKLASGQHEIIAGERRWRAAQLAGLDKVPVIVKDMTDEVAMAVALIENIQRQDLNPIEEAAALARLVEEFGLTQQEVAEKLGKSRTTVTNLLRILNLNPEVRLMLEQGKLELGHAKVLLALEGQNQTQVARLASLKGLTVRETEALVKKALNPSQKSKTASLDPNVKRLKQDLEETLGARVELKHTPKGKGQLVIHYNSLDELDGILSHVR